MLFSRKPNMLPLMIFHYINRSLHKYLDKFYTLHESIEFLSSIPYNGSEDFEIIDIYRKTQLKEQISAWIIQNKSF